MNKNRTIFISLLLLVLYGFFGALAISYQNFQNNACPHLFSIPVCYVVLAAYSLMLMSLLIPHKGCKHHFFSVGWGMAFIIALLASIAEFFSAGAVCPTAQAGMRGGSDLSVVIPTCYISLALLIVILGLFIKGPYKKICNLPS
ncbi:hypothetical protein ABFY09_14410 [Marinomonas sp. 5E14-1]|uniref:hypothetical protein n=1 Tax=Marinomonas sp. 5E14-1 TaxID=3153922 RepID=UPI003265006C